MWEAELKAALEAGLLASKRVMEIYHDGFAVEIKDDDSPVTIADKQADKIIRDYLNSKFPTHAFLTEESTDDLARLKNDYVWIVDPIDGTKDFIAKDDEFTVNIALCYKHRIVVGVVIAPALDELYFASENNGAFYQKTMQKPVKINVNDKLSDLTIFTSVFHFNNDEAAWIAKHQSLIKDVKKRGSSLKPCEIARGLGEVTLRFSPRTKEWDIAACYIIVKEAGGVFIESDGTEFTFNREDVYNRKGYLVANRIENLHL